MAQGPQAVPRDRGDEVSEPRERLSSRMLEDIERRLAPGVYPHGATHGEVRSLIAEVRELRAFKECGLDDTEATIASLRTLVAKQQAVVEAGVKLRERLGARSLLAEPAYSIACEWDAALAALSAPPAESGEEEGK